MTEQSNRGASEELSGAPATPEEDNSPASPASTPGPADVHAAGAAEDRLDPQT